MPTRNIKGRDYALVVLKTVEWDEQGRPSTCTVGYDGTTFHLEGGEDFWTCWVPVAMLKTYTKQ